MNTDDHVRKGNIALAPLPADRALEAFFLEARCKLLDVAGILDRINRGLPDCELANDPRLEKVHQALEVLQGPSGGRAERIQKIFSLDYDPTWERPKPK